MESNHRGHEVAATDAGSMVLLPTSNPFSSRSPPPERGMAVPGSGHDLTGVSMPWNTTLGSCARTSRSAWRPGRTLRRSQFIQWPHPVLLYGPYCRIIRPKRTTTDDGDVKRPDSLRLVLVSNGNEFGRWHCFMNTLLPSVGYKPFEDRTDAASFCLTVERIVLSGVRRPNSIVSEWMCPATNLNSLCR